MKTPDNNGQSNGQSAEQTTYTQVVDEKTGEIKYVPTNPPEPPPEEPEPGDQKDAEGNPTDEDHEERFKLLREALNIDADDKLAEILARLEANNKRLRFNKRLQSGKLDGRRLCAYKTSDRLFKKKAIKHKNYQFTIMLDTSGSMFSGNSSGPAYSSIEEQIKHCKLTVATESIIKVVKALEKLKIPVAVMAMNQETRLIKEFDTGFMLPDFMRRMRLNIVGRHAGDHNTGGTNEMVAYKETIAYIDRNTQGKRENIVFVLSDGQPGGRVPDVPVYMEDEIQQLRDTTGGEDGTSSLKHYWEKQSKVTAYGIGIMSSARQIPNSRRLDSVETLPEVISNLIQEIIL